MRDERVKSLRRSQIRPHELSSLPQNRSMTFYCKTRFEFQRTASVVDALRLKSLDLPLRGIFSWGFHSKSREMREGVSGKHGSDDYFSGSWSNSQATPQNNQVHCKRASSLGKSTALDEVDSRYHGALRTINRTFSIRVSFPIEFSVFLSYPGEFHRCRCLDPKLNARSARPFQGKVEFLEQRHFRWNNTRRKF